MDTGGPPKPDPLHPAKKLVYQQGRMQRCSLCGDSWLTMSEFATWGAQCPTCEYLEMARRHANSRGFALRDAVKRYLLGVVRAKRATLQQIWKGIEK